MPNIPPTSLALCSAATSASWHPKHISDACRPGRSRAGHTCFRGTMGVGAGTTGLVVVVLAAAVVIVGGG